MFSKCCDWMRSWCSEDESYSETATVELADDGDLNESIPLDDFGTFPTNNLANELLRGQSAQDRNVEASSSSEIARGIAREIAEGNSEENMPSHDTEEFTNASSRRTSRKASKGKSARKDKTHRKEEKSESSLSLEDLLKMISHEKIYTRYIPIDNPTPNGEGKSDIDVIFSTDHGTTVVYESISSIAGPSNRPLTSMEREDILRKEFLKTRNLSRDRYTSYGRTWQQMGVSRYGETEDMKSSENVEKQVAEQASLPNGQGKHACFDTESEKEIDPELKNVVDPASEKEIHPASEEVINPASEKEVDPELGNVVDSSSEKVIDSELENVSHPASGKVIDPELEKVINPGSEKEVDPELKNVFDSVLEKETDHELEKEIEYESEKEIDPKYEHIDFEGNVLQHRLPNNMLKGNELQTSRIDDDTKDGDESRISSEGDSEGHRNEENKMSAENSQSRRKRYEDLSSSKKQKKIWFWKNLKMLVKGKRSHVEGTDGMLSTHFVFQNQNEPSSQHELNRETATSLLETELYGSPKGWSKTLKKSVKCYDVSSAQRKNQMFKKKMDKVMLERSFRRRSMKERCKNKTNIKTPENIPNPRDVFEPRELKEIPITNGHENAVSIGETSFAQDTVKTQAKEESGFSYRAKVYETRDLRQTGAIPKRRPAPVLALAAESSDDDESFFQEEYHFKRQIGRRTLGRRQPGRRARSLEPFRTAPDQPSSTLEQQTPGVSNGKEPSQSQGHVSLELAEFPLLRIQMERLRQFGSPPLNDSSSQSQEEDAPPLPPRPVPWPPSSAAQNPISYNLPKTPTSENSACEDVQLYHQNLSLRSSSDSSIRKKCASWLEEISKYFYEDDDLKNDSVCSSEMRQSSRELGVDPQLENIQIPSELPKTSSLFNLVSSGQTSPNNPLVESNEVKCTPQCPEFSLTTPENLFVLPLQYEGAPVINWAQNSSGLPPPTFQTISVPIANSPSVRYPGSSEILCDVTQKSIQSYYQTEIEISKEDLKLCSHHNQYSDPESSIEYENNPCRKFHKSELLIHLSSNTEDRSRPAVGCVGEATPGKLGGIVRSQSCHNILPASVLEANQGPPKPPRLFITQPALHEPNQHTPVTSEISRENSGYLSSLIHDPQYARVSSKKKLRKSKDASSVAESIQVGCSSTSHQNVPRKTREPHPFKSALAVQSDIEFFI